MKHAILIFFALLLACVCITCRSSHSVDRTIENKSITEQKTTSVRTDSARATSAHRDSTVSTLHVQEFIRITTYGDSGRISSLQEQWRHTGSARLAVSTGRTSAVSVSGQQTVDTVSNVAQTKETVKEQHTADSRPVQGSEWLWVSVGIGLVIVIIAIIVIRKLKR